MGTVVQNIDREISNISVEVQKLTFEGWFETNMIFRNIVEVPDLSPVQFQYPPPCLRARSWRVVALCRVLLPEPNIGIFRQVAEPLLTERQ